MSVPFGPGTVTLTAIDFSCEVTGGAVTHAYDETESKRKLCGTITAATRTRKDGVKFDLENDLDAAGLYATLAGLGENPAPTPIEYTPNTAAGASWSGTVVPLLPSEIGASAYGDPIASSVEWPAVGLLDFTPSTGVTA